MYHCHRQIVIIITDNHYPYSVFIIVVIHILDLKLLKQTQAILKITTRRQCHHLSLLPADQKWCRMVTRAPVGTITSETSRLVQSPYIGLTVICIVSVSLLAGKWCNILQVIYPSSVVSPKQQTGVGRCPGAHFYFSQWLLLFPMTEMTDGKHPAGHLNLIWSPCSHLVWWHWWLAQNMERVVHV